VVQQPGEGDIAALPAESIDLAVAKEKCEANDDCKAISYSGSTGIPKVYYKSTASNIYNDCWKSYSKASGFAPEDGFLPAGDELEEVSSLEAAKSRCSQQRGCAGFSNRESDDKFYLKRTWSPPHHDCWTTLEKGDGGEEPDYYGAAQASYYGGAEEAAAPAASYYGGTEEAAAPDPAYYGAAESSAVTYY